MRDGRWIKVSDHRTADGSIVGIRTDITDLKNREEALFAAKESAEIASRSKSDFLANISHELRSPLNAITGFSELMREELFGPLGSPQYREYIGHVFDSAQHLLNVINDIAKVESGKLESRRPRGGDLRRRRRRNAPRPGARATRRGRNPNASAARAADHRGR
jgi:signal transduction histidine kinase